MPVRSPPAAPVGAAPVMTVLPAEVSRPFWSTVNTPTWVESPYVPGVTAVYATVGYQDDARQARWRVNLVDKGRRADGVAVYQERIRAILAGDALLTQAFILLSSPACATGITPERLREVIHEMAFAAGSRGMVGGQVIDVAHQFQRGHPFRLDQHDAEDVGCQC